MIETHQLTKRYGPLVAVDHLDLAVERGEIFGFVGPDGSGKTTTLRMLAAILTPSEGAAWVNGRDTVREPQQIKEHIGYMAQGFALYGDLSVEENLAFFADIFNVRGAERRTRIERLLRFARLEEFRTRLARHLSGGMQKKLGLACTLIHEPEVVYLDEPTTGVDPVSRREFWDILRGLHLQGITILVSTPYMDEAERCSRVALFYEGRIIVCDTPARIKSLVEGDLIELLPSDLRRARQVLSRLPYVLEVQTYGKLLHVFVASAVEQSALLRQALLDEGLAVEHMRAIRPRMEDTFISLVGRQRGGAAPAAVAAPGGGR